MVREDEDGLDELLWLGKLEQRIEKLEKKHAQTVAVCEGGAGGRNQDLGESQRVDGMERPWKRKKGGREKGCESGYDKYERYGDFKNRGRRDRDRENKRQRE